MATLTDVEQDFSPSPRVTRVLAPRTSFVAQDVVDTLRKIEDTFRGMSEPKLIDASGKEDLGAFQVGITYQLQNNQIQFEDRQTPAQTGTITTASGTPIGNRIRVIDSLATFTTNNVVRGSFIVNWTDQSIVSVLNVIGQTELEVYVPTSGISNDYAFGDAYSVFNVDLCDLSGGNSTAVDGVAATISSVVPSVGTYVVLAQSSNATIVESVDTAALTTKVNEIHGQLRRSVYIDTAAGVNGNGYQQTPFNNITDGIDEAENNGLTSLVFMNDATLDRQLRNFDVSGIGDPVIDLNGQDIAGSRFSWVSIDGTGIGAADYERCSIRNNVAGMEGHMHRCGIQGAVTMAVNAKLVMEQCYSEVAGLLTPSVSLNTASTSAALSIRFYSGGIEIRESQASGNSTTVEVPAGRIKLAASNTAGTISVRGTADLDDTSGGATIDKEALLWPKVLLTIKKFIGLS